MGSSRRVKLLNRQIKAMCNLCVGDDLFLPCPAENSTFPWNNSPSIDERNLRMEREKSTPKTETSSPRDGILRSSFEYKAMQQ